MNHADLAGLFDMRWITIRSTWLKGGISW